MRTLLHRGNELSDLDLELLFAIYLTKLGRGRLVEQHGATLRLVFLT
jgi:hypothetical protein